MLLDYSEVKKADEKAMLQLLAKAYLDGIYKLIKRKDFDVNQFHEDVSELFKAYL